MKFWLRQQLFAFKEFCMEMRLPHQYLQNYKRHEFDQGHSRKFLETSFYRRSIRRVVLVFFYLNVTCRTQVTFKQKTLKQLV